MNVRILFLFSGFSLYCNVYRVTQILESLLNLVDQHLDLSFTAFLDNQPVREQSQNHDALKL